MFLIGHSQAGRWWRVKTATGLVLFLEALSWQREYYLRWHLPLALAGLCLLGKPGSIFGLLLLCRNALVSPSVAHGARDQRLLKSQEWSCHAGVSYPTLRSVPTLRWAAVFRSYVWLWTRAGNRWGYDVHPGDWEHCWWLYAPGSCNNGWWERLVGSSQACISPLF